MNYQNMIPNKQVGQYGWNTDILIDKEGLSNVYLGKKMNTNDSQLFAIKIIKKTDLDTNAKIETFNNELSILTQLQGEANILGLEDHIESTTSQYLIQKFCNGSDLRTMLSKKQKVPESEARQIFKDIINGVTVLITRNIIHRDLKPENILFNDNRCYITNFRSALYVPNFEDDQMNAFVGTPLYVSPQIMDNKPYTTKCDIWSLGIIYYEMLFGSTPFPCATLPELKAKTLNMAVPFPSNVTISQQSKQFLQKCLQVEEQNRMSWTDLLKDPLFKQSGEESNQLLLQMRADKVIKQIMVVAKRKNIDLKSLFAKYDRSGDNYLDQIELGSTLLKIDNTLSKNEIDYIFKDFDKDRNGKININEFVERMEFQKDQVAEPQKERLEVSRKNASNPVDTMMLATTNIAMSQQPQPQPQQQNQYQSYLSSNQNNLQNQTQLLQKSKQQKSVNPIYGSQINNIDMYGALVASSDMRMRDNLRDQNNQSIKYQSRMLSSTSLQNISLINDLVTNRSGYSQKELRSHELYLSLSSKDKVKVNKLKHAIEKQDLDIAMMFRKFDPENTNQLNLAQFTDLLAFYTHQQTQQQVLPIFQAIDLDDDGYITLEEFDATFRRPSVWRQIQAKLPTEDTPQDEALRRKIFRLFDPNHSGQLSLSEVQFGLRDVLHIDQLFEAKKAVARAFHAAKDYNQFQNRASLASQKHQTTSKSRVLSLSNKEQQLLNSVLQEKRANMLKSGEIVPYNEMKHVNLNDTNYIQFDEFKLFLIFVRQYFEYWVMWKRLKTDKTWFEPLSLEQFLKGLPLLRLWGATIEDPLSEYKRIDQNGGGKILFDEFCTWAIQQKLDLEDDDDFKFNEGLLVGKDNLCVNWNKK